jgi:cytochrome c biogenesis protein ResB
VVDDTPVGMLVTFTDQQDREHLVEINRPLRLRGCSLVVQDLGVAPLVVLADETGREIDGAWVKLDVLQGQTDIFQMAELDFTAAFFPDLVMVDGQPRTRSRQFNNPALWLLVSRAGEILADTTVRPGEEILMGRMRLMVPEIRFWARFYVRQESGLWLVWTGFALATFALVWRLVFYRREYWVAYLEEDGAVAAINVAGRAEFFRALFQEEFDSTVERLRRHMAGDTRHG